MALRRRNTKVQPLGPLSLQVVATEPRVLKIDGFLSDWECDYIIAQHRPHMQRSTTGNGENTKVESVRTSLSHRMNRDSYPLADVIYRRLASVIKVPHEMLVHGRNAEPINIVYYQKTQEYTPHYDEGSDGTPHSRFISALLYFNTPAAGGATSFPKSIAKDGTEGIRVSAKKGSIVFFYDLLADGNIDEFSLHAGEPVLAGEKWIGAAWIWEPNRGEQTRDESVSLLKKHGFLSRYLPSEHQDL